MTGPRAIETRYKGYRFRSRLEARWAVYLDALGVRWEYETQGFELPGGRYLPDFWLPDWSVFGEVKATPDEFDERHDQLVLASGFDLICMVGTPSPMHYPMRVLAWFGPDESAIVDDWIHFGLSARKGRVWHSMGEEPKGAYFSWPEHDAAIAAARGARFEYGERGR